jgi:hypothetical protein
MKARVLFERGVDGAPHGCGHVRLLRPLEHPKAAGALGWSAGHDDDDRADVVVVERLWQPTVTIAAIETLIRHVRRREARLLYTIDDNLLDLRPWSASYLSSLKSRGRSCVC